MLQTSLEDIKRIAKEGDYRRIPVVRELLSDIRTPVGLLRVLLNVSSHTFMLESVEDSRQWGRYSFLGYEPSMEISCKDHILRVVKDGKVTTEHVEHPSAYIRSVINENRAPKLPDMPTLTGGLVGYFSYDYVQYGERSLKLKGEDTERFDDVNLMLFDDMICFDNLRQKIMLISNIHTGDIENDYIRVTAKLDEMEELVRNGRMKEDTGGHLVGELKPLLTEKEFSEKIERIRHHIYEGDIFQLVFSNPMEAEYEGSLLNTYRVLRTTNPSPYMFYFSGDDIEMAGASPETLVKVEGGTVRTFPLAGTRPRGSDYEEDMRLEKELLADEKERAEHNMLVDLGRNDIGRLSSFGSVRVDKYMKVERYSHVMHIGSEVVGQMREELHAIDAVDSVLPAGTLSGAPKIRAMEIIDELEGDRRGIYGGAIGYVDFAGNLDVCIAIRLAYKRKGKVFVRSGAGIVADSVPENEYRECINKARAVTEALKQGEEL
ncbi:MAG: anthranilate synthase component I [Lachnospiraceae bacterium]|nr:anthranilate synthase component I [Lachnospiraceae bacterium]